jgi:hypothetical protein
MWIDQRGSEILTDSEGLRLLAVAAKEESIGRLALSMPEAPIVQPVNFTYHDHRVLVRLGEGHMAESADGALVAFEVDRLDRMHEEAWSVLVRGLATMLTQEECQGLKGVGPQPLVPHPGERVFAIRTDVVSGRRFQLASDTRSVPASAVAPSRVGKDARVALMDALHTAQPDVLQEASAALRRAHLTHYEASGNAASGQNLQHLFALVVGCLEQRTLVPIVRYAQAIAEKRFVSGFDIAEVQTAFNVLEESIWHVVIAKLEPDELAVSAGMVGTVLGVGKDTLARTWVSQAASRHVPSLDLSALFEGMSS